MKLINTRVITTALTVVTALVVTACAGGELKEHTFELQVQKQSLTQGDSVLRVKKDDTVTIVVTSDEPISFHLHGYDIEKEARPNEPATLAFTANDTGSFPFTIHVVEGSHEGVESHVEGEGEHPAEEEADPEDEVELGRLEVRPR